MNEYLTAVVIDDHPLFRGGVVHILNSKNVQVVAEGATAEQAVELTQTHQPDILLLDMKLPGGGQSAIQTIVAKASSTPILVLSAIDEVECVAGAFRDGVRGYLLKGAGGDDLVDAVRTVARGDLYVASQLINVLVGRMSATMDDQPGPRPEFSEREEQILTLISHGLSNKEIAFRLTLSEKTVKYYVTHILKKLNVRNRVEAALFATHRAMSRAADTVPIPAFGRRRAYPMAEP